jgi:hypothetical protein
MIDKATTTAHGVTWDSNDREGSGWEALHIVLF